MALTIDDGDRLMARLIEARDSLPERAVEPFFARLILLLANEIGDLTALLEAIDKALPRGSEVSTVSDNGSLQPASTGDE